MRKLIIPLLLGCTASPLAQAAMPVTVVSDQQAWTAHLAEMAKMVGTIKRLEAQIEQMRQQYAALTGSRGLANVVNTAYDTDVARGVDIDGVLQQNGLKPSSTYQMPADAAQLYDEGNNAAAQIRAAVAQKSMEQVQQRFQDLTGLLAKVNDSNDPKDVLDLQARIATEQTFLANENLKIQILAQQQAAHEALRQQQIKQMSVKSSGELKSVKWEIVK